MVRGANSNPFSCHSSSQRRLASKTTSRRRPYISPSLRLSRSFPSPNPRPRNSIMTAALSTAQQQVLAGESSNSSGQITPSHGGTVVAGVEYDLPITKRSTEMPSSPQTPRSTAPPTRDATPPVSAPTARSSTSSRPRPLSMPPQAIAPAAVPTNGAGEEAVKPRHASTTTKRSSNRILGDYTLSKTLGAGSMGKVKLGTHNITGEKVRRYPSITAYSCAYLRFSLPSRFFPASTLGSTSTVRAQRLRLSRLRRMCPKRFGHCVRPHCPCCCTTLTFAGCGR